MNTQFKGVWTPDFIMEMVWNGELTPTDAFLLSTIFALSKRKEGCTASREYLAKCIGVSVPHIKKLLTKYRKMKLIANMDFNGRIQAIKTCWDNDPRIRQQYPRSYGSSSVDATAEKTSSDSSSARGSVDATADQATNNTYNIFNSKKNSKKIEETGKEEANKEEASISIPIGLPKLSQTYKATRKEKQPFRGYQKYQPRQSTPQNQGTLEDSLVDNLPMYDGACGEEIRQLAAKLKVLKKDVYDKKLAYIAWVMAKPNDPSRWGLDMAKMVEVFLNNDLASGKLEHYYTTREQIEMMGFPIMKGNNE